jgi:hypothetical protein
LSLVVILAFGIIGLNSSAVNAQPGPPAPKLTFGDGNYVDPYAGIRTWTGMSYLSKDAYDGEKSKTNTWVGFPMSASNVMGIKMKVGKLYSNATWITTYYNQWNGNSANLDLDVRYQATDSFAIGFGEGHTSMMTNLGCTPPLDTVYAEGLAGYSVDFGPGAQYLGVNFMGAYAAIYSTETADSTNTEVVFSNIKTVIPRFAIGYATPFPMQAGAFFVYQKVKGDVSTSFLHGNSTFAGEEVTSYAGQVFFDDMMLGPASLHAGAFYGQNINDAGLMCPLMPDTSNPTFSAQIAGGKVTNVKAYGANFAFAYRIGMVQPAAGFGYRASKIKGADQADAEYAIFARVGFSVAPGFTIYPGVQYVDQMEDSTGKKQGHVIWAGILWEAMI